MNEPLQMRIRRNLGFLCIALLGSIALPGSLLAQQTIYSYSVPSGGYSPNGNISNFSDYITGGWNMQYDNLNRLQNATSSSGYYNGLTLQWQYDSFGNRLSQTPSGTYAPFVPGAISATYDQNNRIANSSVPGMGPSSYDAAGNVIFDGNNHVAYDAEGRVCAVLNGSATLTQYLYNAEGQRVAKGHSASGNTLACPAYGDFVADEKYILGQGAEQVTQLSGSDQWQHSNVWANGQLLATYDPQGLHFNITDPLGTKRVQASAGGAVEQICVSLPFGDGLNCFGNADATQHHFTGKERDSESGLDYFGARYYGSSMGRFMSPDWAEKPESVPYSDLTDPQSLNLYGYVRNNPLSRADVNGHQQEPAPAREEIESEIREEAEMEARAQVRMRQAHADEFNRRAVAAGATGPALSPEEVENAEAAGIAKIHEAMQSYGYKSPSFVSTPGGDNIPIPSGATGPTPVVNGAGDVTGSQYQGGSGGQGLDPKVTGVRIMNPTPAKGNAPAYPNGYVSYNNNSTPRPQTVNPQTGRTVPKSDPSAHISLKPIQ